MRVPRPGTPGSIGAGAPVNQPDTSATSCVVRCACNDTAPPPPIATMARLATVCHVRTVLRLDVGGSAVRAGYAVTKPASDDSVAVRFITTAATPVVGMPARPARGRSARKPPWRRGSGAAARESSTRAGVSGTNRPSVDGAALASVNVPTRSITTCVVLCTKTATRPVASTGVTTMLATVSPACSTFRLEASGCGAPAGHTVTKPGADASVAVTFSTAPEAWAAAGPSSTTWVLPAATGAPVRVSSTRVGPVGTQPPRTRTGRRLPGADHVDHEIGRREGEDVDGAVVADGHDHQVRNGLTGPLHVQVRGLGAGKPGRPHGHEPGCRRVRGGDVEGDGGGVRRHARPPGDRHPRRRPVARGRARGAGVEQARRHDGDVRRRRCRGRGDRVDGGGGVPTGAQCRRHQEHRQDGRGGAADRAGRRGCVLGVLRLTCETEHA